MKTMKSILTIILLLATFSIFAQEMKVDAKNSSIKWHGEKVTGEHFGTIDIKSGNLILKDNKIISGEFIIDMSSIKNTDIEDAEYKAKLEGHLKTDDFFGVEKYPTAKLYILSSDEFKDNIAKVKANITIKGITNAIEFDVTKDGNKFSADIVIDRSKFNVRYGSGSFFDNLGDKTIYDEFKLSVVLITL